METVIQFVEDFAATRNQRLSEEDCPQHLVKLSAAVGRLLEASTSVNSPAAMSTFEHRRLSKLVGEVVLCVAEVAVASGVALDLAAPPQPPVTPPQRPPGLPLAAGGSTSSHEESRGVEVPQHPVRDDFWRALLSAKGLGATGPVQCVPSHYVASSRAPSSHAPSPPASDAISPVQVQLPRRISPPQAPRDLSPESSPRRPSGFGSQYLHAGYPHTRQNGPASRAATPLGYMCSGASSGLQSPTTASPGGSGLLTIMDASQGGLLGRPGSEDDLLGPLGAVPVTSLTSASPVQSRLDTHRRGSGFTLDPRLMDHPINHGYMQ